MRYNNRPFLLLTLALAAGAAAHEVSLPPELADPSATVVLVKDGLGFTEGPAADTGGVLLFTEPPDSEIWRVGPDGAVTLWRAKSNGANGLLFDARGGLIACEHGMVTRTAGTQRTVLAEGVGEANDVTLCADGGMYFTSPVWDGVGDVYYLPPGGKPTVVIGKTAGFPNGIEYLEEKQLLYVAFTQRNVVRSYPVRPDRTLGPPSDFVDSVNMPDGMALDERANLWVTAHRDGAVYVYDSTGATLGHVKLSGGHTVQNCAFGGADGRTLFIAAARAVFKVQVKVKGRVPTGSPAAH